ncbi:hypothetical protein J7337_006346, partial [Fusarium musae]
IATGFNVALDYGQDLLNSSEFTVDSWLENLRKLIKSQLPGLQNNNYSGSQQVARGLHEENSNLSAEDQSADDAIKSGVAYNWSTYYFTYGGGTTNAVLNDDGKSYSTEKAIVALWDGVQSEIDTIVGTISKLVKDLFDFFKSGPGHWDIKSFMGHITADLVDGMIDSLKILADILFKAFSLGISLVKDVANQTIEIPVLGWLWKMLTHGRSLSLLELCSLLIAIPTKVLYKAKTGHAPPKLKGRLTKDSFRRYLSGTADSALAREKLSTADSTLFKDIANVSLAVTANLEFIYNEFDTLVLLADGAFEGSGLEIIPTGPIKTLMTVINAAELIFEGIDAFASLPAGLLPGSSMVQVDNATVGKVAKYSAFGLQGVKFAAGIVVKIVGKVKSLDQMVIKRWKGGITAVISMPMLCVALTADINDSVEGRKKTVIVVDHFFEHFLKFGKQWGYAVACWNNDVENELLYIALVVKVLCGDGIYGFKITDFVVDHV